MTKRLERLQEIDSRLEEITQYIESIDDLEESTQKEYFRLIDEIKELAD